MDLNYLLGREQHALYMAQTSLSTSARMAHRAFAKAYGVLIAGSGFPHRDSSSRQGRPPPRQSPSDSNARIGDWESEGGSLAQKFGSLVKSKAISPRKPLANNEPSA